MKPTVKRIQPIITKKYYEPSIMEYRSFQRHLSGLRSMMLKNEIALTYLRARYGEEDIITSVATAEYTRKRPEEQLYRTSQLCRAKWLGKRQHGSGRADTGRSRHSGTR